MKKIICILSVVFISMSMLAQDDKYYDNGTTDDVYNNDNNDQDQYVEDQSYKTFYDELDKYGSWIQNPDYGYVWVPLQAGAGFSPYLTNGHWEYTDYGWTWVSDFEWGWATFHYGRWYLDPGYGWIWVPGYDWAPAWVIWGEYDNYYCWAPAWPGEYTSTHYGGREHHWYFVDHGHINDHQISSQVVSNTVVNHNKTDIESHINIISHVNTYKQSVFFSGPKVKDVEKATGHSIDKVNVKTADKAGATRVTGQEIAVYRPDIKREEKQNTAPSRVGRTEDIPRSNDRTASPSQPTIPQRQNTMPQRDGFNQRSEPPVQQQWTPPRQNMPREQVPQSQPVQSRPVERGGGFVPAERAMPQQQRQFSPPAPVRQSAPPPMHMSGGGRH